jgi:general secretion pathway protein D
MRPELRLGMPHPPCGACRATPDPHGRILARLLGSVLLALVISSSGAATEVQFTFDAQEIETVLEKAGELTGITFVFDPEQIHGKITILAPGKLSSEDVVDLLDSALRLHGYTLVRQGSSALVVPAARAMRRIEEVFEVVPLDYARAEELAYTLTLLAPGVRIVPDPRTNSLVIGGDPETVNELLNLIKGQARGNGDGE